MTEEPWNKHTPGDPMPCKCGDSVVEVLFGDGTSPIDSARFWAWTKRHSDVEITAWRFIERKGEDMIAADTLRLLDEIERLRGVLERIETASRHWADYEAAPDAVHYAHECTARLARAALAKGGSDDR